MYVMHWFQIWPEVHGSVDTQGEASQKGGSKALWGGSNPWIELLYLLDQGYAVKLGWKEAEIIHCYL